MEYSEEAYQVLLKMRSIGKKNYDEERYTQSLVDLRKADKALQEAMNAYKKDPSVENEEIMDHRDYDVFCEKIKSSYLRDVMEGKVQDPKMTDTMYELHGYKVKEECDKAFNDWSLKFFGPEGYWVPGMPTR
jgi:hypothetical protein